VKAYGKKVRETITKDSRKKGVLLIHEPVFKEKGKGGSMSAVKKKKMR